MGIDWGAVALAGAAWSGLVVGSFIWGVMQDCKNTPEAQAAKEQAGYDALTDYLKLDEMFFTNSGIRFEVSRATLLAVHQTSAVHGDHFGHYRRTRVTHLYVDTLTGVPFWIDMWRRWQPLDGDKDSDLVTGRGIVTQYGVIDSLPDMFDTLSWVDREVLLKTDLRAFRYMSDVRKLPDDEFYRLTETSHGIAA